jgi:solute carrier family 24 (sodium/potassium/calcium exchanger), member 6
MYTLSSTADIYLSPSLEYLTVRFGLSDSLAGVTLLAFGNGAPDVFGAIAAASAEGSSDANKSVAIICGGTFFISCVVVSLSTYASNLNSTGGPPDRRIKVTPRFFIRDIVFLLLTVVYLMGIFLLLGEFNIYTAVGLIVIYAIYVVLVVCQSRG